MSLSERNRLPGGPSNVLIRGVRRQLKRYGISPTHDNGKLWNATWQWAHAICESYMFPHMLHKRHRWPSAREIAAQYTFLLLNAMREGRDLKLPYRAADNMPASVRALLPAPAATAIVATTRIEQLSLPLLDEVS